jgi:hypothetical protein
MGFIGDEDDADEVILAPLDEPGNPAEPELPAVPEPVAVPA